MGKGQGGGGLRILPHKSWHVWNWENRKKVKQDEAKFNEEDAQKRAKAQREEATFRVNLLRERQKRKYDELEDKLQRQVKTNSTKIHGKGRDISRNSGGADEENTTTKVAKGNVGDMKDDYSGSTKSVCRVSSPPDRKKRRRDDMIDLEKLLAKNESVGYLMTTSDDGTKPRVTQSAVEAPPAERFSLFNDEELREQTKSLQQKDIEKKELQKKELEWTKRNIPESFFGASAIDPRTGRKPWYAIGEVEKERIEELATSKASREASRATGHNLQHFGRPESALSNLRLVSSMSSPSEHIVAAASSYLEIDPLAVIKKCTTSSASLSHVPTPSYMVCAESLNRMHPPAQSTASSSSSSRSAKSKERKKDKKGKKKSKKRHKKEKSRRKHDADAEESGSCSDDSSDGLARDDFPRTRVESTRPNDTRPKDIEGQVMMDNLRKERMEREASERSRASAVLPVRSAGPLDVTGYSTASRYMPFMKV